MWLNAPTKKISPIAIPTAKKTLPILSTFYNFQDLTPEQKRKRIEIENQASQQEAERLNSFGGLVKETIKGTMERVAKIPISIAQNTWEEWKRTPKKIQEDIETGAEAFTEKGKTSLQKATKTMWRGGMRPAADMAIAIFAPISSALSAILEATGGQKLINKTGEIVADKTGITDIKAFQKFAMEHPNAGEDFNRLLMLGMAGMEKGKIEPKKWASEAKIIANKLVESAQPIKVPEIKPEIKSIATTLPDGRPTPILKTFEGIKKEPFKPLPREPYYSETSIKIAKEAKARGLLEDYPELSKVEPITVAEQTLKAREAIKRDRDLAIKQVRSVEVPELYKESLFKELKKQAFDEGDLTTIRTLSKSNIGTEAARGLKMLDEGTKFDADPIRAIRNTRNVRIKEVEKTQKIDVEKTIKNEKASFKEPEVDLTSWSGFLKSIEC